LQIAGFDGDITHQAVVTTKGFERVSTSPSIVVLDRVMKSYGDVVAVDQATLAIKRGEFFAIVGPSGSGKTTLLRAIAGFVFPDSGRILIDGKDVSRVPPYRRPCNMVFQHYALFPHLSVFDNIAFGLIEKHVPRREISKRVRSILELVHLPGLASRSIDQLSGGQQQRVALARALVNDPVVILLDEPLGALDAKLRKAMQLELKRIQREVGMTFVHVTHDQEEALVMSDRLAVMNLGVIQQVGAPQDIYNRPANEFVADFIGESNLFEGSVTDRPDDVSVRVQLDNGASTIVPIRSTHWQQGQSVKVLLRPEYLKISGELPTSEFNSYRGRISTKVFQGAAVRFEVMTDDSRKIVALTPASEAVAAGEGEQVWLYWSTRDGYIIGDQN
jgi:spermidine/putrescine transport system ATP-binding protein